MTIPEMKRTAHINSFTGNDPRKGWRTLLKNIKCSEQRDEETGYSYFGARYMDHELMTLWLSVDPMADKYPGISPYAYCAWNPVKLVDPDGKEIDDYRLNICTGELRFYQLTNETRDCIYAGYYDENNEWVDVCNTFDCAKGLLIPDNSIDNATQHIVTNESDGLG